MESPPYLIINHTHRPASASSIAHLLPMCQVPRQGIEPRQPKQVVYSHPPTPVGHTRRVNQEALTLGRDRLLRVNFPNPYG